MKEFIPLASFLVTVTLMDRYRRTAMLLAYRMFCLLRDSGRLMTVQYLAEASRLVVLWLAGNPETQAPREGGKVRVRRDKHGLPCIIPKFLRQQMLREEPGSIRLVLSLLAFYRIVRLPMVLKISTITDLGPIVDPRLVEEIYSTMSRYFRNVPRYQFRFSWRFSVSAGPNGKHATRSCLNDAAAFLFEPKVLWSFVRLAPWYITVYMLFLGVVRYLGLLITTPGKYITPGGEVRLWFPNHFQTPRGDYRRLSLGRLSVKLEAKGKARVFAITDWWSQGLLYHLHTYLFQILKGIGQDGTFDQSAPLRRLRRNMESTVPVFSYDLSAATDRLPVWVQIATLRALCPYASEWAFLLVGRW